MGRESSSSALKDGLHSKEQPVHSELWKELRPRVRAWLADEQGQTTTEYMLGISVVVIGMSLAFVYMSNSTRSIFDNARRMIELPYP